MSVSQSDGFPTLPASTGAPQVFRAAFQAVARGWKGGSLCITLPGGAVVRVPRNGDGPDAALAVHDFGFLRRVLASGDIGFAEGYVAGEWDTPDLPALLQAFALNFDRIGRLGAGGPVMQFANLLLHLLKPNSREGARRNIEAHYDLGNKFYAAWLDPSLTYSSALYTSPDQPLESAQRDKYAALARAIGLSSHHSVLEIGCGWGGFAEFAAREIGARVTAVTISKAQHAFARERIQRAGLSERVDIQMTDYRDVTSRHDRVVSIEMFEAVGERYWPAYFAKIREVLVPGGLAGLQVITIRDELFEDYRKRVDFIRKYVFPGGMLPSQARLRQETSAAGLLWSQARSLRLDYARTLAAWAARFAQVREPLERLGFDERFQRLWRFYLGYCEAGFLTGRTDVIQLALTRA